MASGKVHAQATRKMGFTVTAVSGVAAWMVHPVLLGFAVGAWLGHLATPDLDHHWTTHDEHRMRKVSPLFGWLWSLYWTPYQRTHPHRGWSHTWPRGTFVRWIYLLWLPLAITVAAVPDSLLIWTGLFWLATFAGWSISDEIHYRLDKLK